MNKRQMYAGIVGCMLPIFMWSVVTTITHFLEHYAVDQLRFSTTQNWDENLFDEIAHVPRFVSAMERLPAPPKNTSSQTQTELEVLHALTPLRTFEKKFVINRERDVAGQQYNGVPVLELVYEADRPHTLELLNETHLELRGYILREKAHHDRVRPSHLDPALTTTITIPSHPAYPSGHATESHFFALLFSTLDPPNTDAYMASAASIAHNREIAGVHYASDTAAGVLYAEAYFTLLQESADYAALLEAARTEW